MSDSIHGHEVMQFMLDHPQGFTRESLKAAIIAHFGADARFHTCSHDDMDADAIIDLLAAKGKFVATESGFTTHPDKICKHH